VAGDVRKIWSFTLPLSRKGRVHHMSDVLNPFELTGRARTHVVQFDEPRFALHKEVAEPYFALRDAAAKEGFALHPFSAFRDFDAQLKIWNNKFAGERPLYDQYGIAQDYAKLSEEEIVDLILNWSAIPGASRHHWGTEIDVVDTARVASDYHVKLLPAEYAAGGVFYDLNVWLNENIERFGFFRPYEKYQGGVFAEPWHLSYWPVSQPALEALTFDVLRQAIVENDVMGKQIVLQRLPTLYESHVKNVCLPSTGS
jgi:LAS superfamily LD-carboxypeptidase LdcB